MVIEMEFVYGLHPRLQKTESTELIEDRYVNLHMAAFA